jgi:hypothetical protein
MSPLRLRRSSAARGSRADEGVGPTADCCREMFTGLEERRSSVSCCKHKDSLAEPRA